LIGLTFTFPFKLDIIKNNDEVRQAACKVSEALEMSTNRVYDKYGGTCKKVGFLPESDEVATLVKRYLRRFLADDKNATAANATNATTTTNQTTTPAAPARSSNTDGIAK